MSQDERREKEPRLFEEGREEPHVGENDLPTFTATLNEIKRESVCAE
jgi:hypothetical protein